MTAARGSLRLRLFAVVLAAAVVPMAPFAALLLLQVRDALYARKVADGRERLQTVAEVIDRRCPPGELSCAQPIASAAGATIRETPCAQAVQREGHEALFCAKLYLGSVELREELSPVRLQLESLDRRLLSLLVLFVALLVAIAAWLLNRGFVSRLGQVDAALEQVGVEEEEQTLLPEGGDSVGRVSAAVNRLAQRLSEERGRTRAKIDELQSANTMLREAREDLQRSERLASVGRLAAGVAHEVGNPVAALIGYAALMREKLQPSGSAGEGQEQASRELGEYAARIEREASRIDRILRDLLELARPRELKPVPIDLRRVCEEARLVIEPQAVWRERGTTLAIELPEQLPRALGETHYVVQVLVNLLANAARAGAHAVRISARAPGDSVELSVEDDGPGFPPEALARLFEPFFTTASPGEGTGLGLALSHATMERLSGSISASNLPGAGARFLLTFRVAREAERT